MKTKRLFRLLLTVMILAATLVISVSASTLYQGEYEGGNVKWKITSDGTLTVTGNSYIQSTNSGDYPWHKYASKVTKIVVGDKITDIANSCFHGMTKVTSVTIGKNVQTIGKYAFNGCSSLKSVSIPGTVKSIGQGAFGHCSKLKTVTFAKNSKLTKIDYGVFYNCGLETVTLPEGITVINTSAFSECDNLTSVTFPDSLETIWDLAFGDCDNLTSINVPRNLSWIAIEAFRFCPKLTHLELYRNVDYETHFRYNAIESIVVHDNLDTFTGFSDCTTLKSVTLPDTIKVIGDYALTRCTALKTLDWPASLTTIGKGALAATGLTEIVVPDTVTTLGDGAFGSNPLISFRLNDRIEALPSRCLANCPNLTEVYLGKVKSLGSETFAECSSLVKIDLPETLETIGDRAFQSCTALEGIEIPASVTKIDYSAFAQCKALSAVYFQGSAPEIGPYIFQYNTLDAYYPVGDPSWTDEVKQQYHGTVNWVESDFSHIAPVMSAAATSFNTIEVKWNPLPSSVCYYVYRAAEGGEFVQVATVTDAHYVDADTEAGMTYQYYVVSETADGALSDDSSTVSATAHQDAPVVTASNVLKTGKVKLTWKAIPGAAGYKIYRATTKEGTYKLMYTASSTTYTNSSATAGKYYYYKVVAVDAEGNESAESSIVGRTCDLAQPDISVSNVPRTGKVRITWPRVIGAVEYKVYRSTAKNGPFKLMKTLTTTTYTNTSAAVGEGYYYKVVAVANKSAANSTSEVKHRTVDLPQVQPTITLNAKGKPSITWEPVEGAIAYKVYRSTDKNRDYSLTKTLTSTNYVNTSAVKGYTYYYKVVAVHPVSGANSANSEIVSITCTK